MLDSRSRRRIAAASLAILIPALGPTASPARAQCEPAWHSTGESPGIPNTLPGSPISKLMTWDPDGPDGPEPPNLVVAGQFTEAGSTTSLNVARWDGAAWRPFGSPLFGMRVRAMTLWDPDGDGPLAPTPVVGTSFADGLIYRWTGQAWQAMGSSTGVITTIYALVSWDPDGDGPQPAQLIAGGDFFRPAPNLMRRLARWNGTAWEELGGGLNGTAYMLEATPAGLIVGGDFTMAGTTPANRIARWTGTAWEPLGTGMNDSVRCALVRGGDLIVGGLFTSAGGVTARSIARWDGLAWSTLGAGFFGGSPTQVTGLCDWDADGPGPIESRLVAAGYFNTVLGLPNVNLAEWNGSAWQVLGGGTSNFSSAVLDWDPDGDGPQPEQLVCAGYFTTLGGTIVNCIGRWDGTRWRPFGAGLGVETGYGATVSALAAWDPDGDGPLTTQVIAGGNFRIAGEEPTYGVAKWDGARWRPIRPEPLSNNIVSVTDFLVFDPDEGGPAPAELIAAGGFIFTAPDGSPGRGIARWDGTNWQPLGGPMNNRANAVVAWDPDGGGPQAPQLVAGGTFTSVAGTPASLIARWDGAAWHPFGPGLSGGASPGVNALAVLDADGDGPEPGQLFAAGSFTLPGQSTSNNVARWNGAAWEPIGPGFQNSVTELIAWDPDGPGPQPPQLVAGGTFVESAGVQGRYVAVWNGSVWQSLGQGIGASSGASVSALGTWDADGPGPAPARLLVGGSFTSAGGQTVNRIALWDGAAWSPLASGVRGSVRELIEWDADGSGPGLPMVVAGGSLTGSMDVPSSAVVIYGCPSPCTPPTAPPDQPASTTTCRGGAAVFTVEPSGTISDIRWRRNGAVLTNGPTGAGSIINGAHTTTLRIASASAADAGLYTCDLSGPCGETTSPAAALSVCVADADCNLRIEPADISLFVITWLTSVNEGTLAGDFDTSGAVNPADVAAFVAAWFTALTGGC